MRKILKNILSHGIVFVVSGIIFTIIGVYAATQIASSQVTYNNTTVDAALNDLYNKTASIECAEGYKKGNVNGNKYECVIPICKRATTLHTENCEQTSKYCAGDGYTQGATITYGNLGTTGTLATGDAFDCDVNGDGTYDSQSERFYYVTDVDTNTAFLIYYNDFVASGVAYDAGGDAYTNGPVTAIANLPTTTNWPNVSLTNSIRDIKDETGAVKKSGFDYGNKAARLITYQEINAGCYDGTTDITSTGGLSSKCKFLMENTKYSKSSNPTYGTWTETALSYDFGFAWYVRGNYRYVNNGSYVNNASVYGARPGIEVLKSNISY